jgi:hypothetical protein
VKRCRHVWLALEEHGVWLWCRQCGAVRCEDAIFRPPLKQVKL